MFYTPKMTNYKKKVSVRINQNQIEENVTERKKKNTTMSITKKTSTNSVGSQRVLSREKSVSSASPVLKNRIRNLAEVN